jgi:mRNA interferase RelE/StbE
MEIEVKKSFVKSLKITPKHIQQAFQKIILPKLIEASSIESSGLDFVKMSGIKKDENYYRIRVGEWRIGIEVKSPKIILITILSRGAIYKRFP